MSGFTLRVGSDFCAGHRLWGADIQCCFPHGHNFCAELFLRAAEPGSLGMVVDFADVKGALSTWITTNWDHAFLVNSNDTEMLRCLRELSHAKVYEFNHRNPTAENMAKELFQAIVASAGFADRITKVRIWETATQYAEYQP